MSDLTYPEVGATELGELPAGYHHTVRRQRLGAAELFPRAAQALRGWQPQRGAGLKVRTDATEPAVGVRFATGMGVGPLRLWAPCEIVWLVDRPDRYGFGFGTRPGHPETGEESFLLTILDGGLWFDVRAFSRADAWWVKPGQPIARLVQNRITDKYVRSMREVLNKPGNTP